MKVKVSIGLIILPLFFLQGLSICTHASDFDSPESIHVIKARYVDVSTVVQSLPDELSSYVKVDEARNLMFVTASPAIAKKIEDIVNLQDVPPGQILIEILAVEMSTEKGSSIDIDWSWQWSGEREEVEGVSIDGLAVGYTSPDIETTIEALAFEGEARILSNPRIIALENMTARIGLESEQYFQVLAEEAEETYLEVEPITVATNVEIQPRLINNRDVFLNVKILVGNLDESTRVPRIHRRSVVTTVRAEHGQTIVLAGLSEEVQQEISSRVWGLGRIPVASILFSREYHMERKTELVIFITPYILGKKLPSSDVALTAGTWNTWSPPPEHDIESAEFTPQLDLGVKNWSNSEHEGGSGYEAQIAYSPFYTWTINGGYSRFMEEKWQILSWRIGFCKQLVRIKEDLSTGFHYQLREGKPTSDSKEKSFQQNIYSLFLEDKRSIIGNLKFTGRVSCAFVEEKGDFSPLLTALSAGPVYQLGEKLEFSGEYIYMFSEDERFCWQGYTLGLEYRLLGERLSITGGYQSSDGESIRYMVGSSLPSAGYYAGVTYSFR